jgi:hypothetical protein
LRVETSESLFLRAAASICMRAANQERGRILLSEMGCKQATGTRQDTALRNQRVA